MNFYLNWHSKLEGSRLKLQNLLNKKQTFNFDPLQFPCQLSKVHTVPHFKASFNAKLEPSWLKHGGIFTLLPTVLKTGSLVQKTVVV